MPRSLGFGSDPTNSILNEEGRPIKTRFRCAYTYRLKLACETKSLTHYTKGTPSPRQIRRSREAPTDCRRSVSGTVSLPSSGYFSPFPHGTSALSVSKEYLAFEGGPPMFRQNFTCSALLNTSDHASDTGLSPILPNFPDGSRHIHSSAGPRSLAATKGVSVDFLSSGYLDVSVPRVCSFNPIYSGKKYLVYHIIEYHAMIPTVRG
jgi:hypothetical protein